MTAGSTVLRPLRSRRSARAAVGVAGLLLLACATVGVGAHFLGPVSTVVTLAASFTPLCVALAAVATLMLVAARWRYPALAGVLADSAGTEAAFMFGAVLVLSVSLLSLVTRWQPRASD